MMMLTMLGAVYSENAFAIPASKLNQARAIKKQVDALDARVEMAAEKYNEASEKLAKATERRRGAETRLAATKERIGVVQGHLNLRANRMYRQGPDGFVEVLFGAQSFNDFAATWDILNTLNEQDAANAIELKALKVEQIALKKTLLAQEKVASQSAAAMQQNKASIEAQLADRQNKLKGLETEIAALKRAEEAAAQYSSGGSTSSGGRVFPAPTRAPRGEVVSIAKRYLGAPYQWAAAGPNRFDCSGFTMFVYRQVGVSLPHSSRSQIGSGERVSRGDLQPGDLVFFGSPIHHVGMYVGGNQYIHAPSTGDVVKISSMSRGDFAGGSRP